MRRNIWISAKLFNRHMWFHYNDGDIEVLLSGKALPPSALRNGHAGPAGTAVSFLHRRRVAAEGCPLNRALALFRKAASALGLTGALVSGAISGAHAQADYVPPLSATVLTQWQIQGEYYGAAEDGGKLGAWLVANGDDSYTVVFLPGGLLTLPGQEYGGWNRAGWDRSAFSGKGLLNGTSFAVNTPSNYQAAAIIGSEETRTITGASPTGSAFALHRVVRNSPTHGLKPKTAWGPATLWFDSVTGQADLGKWAPKDNAVQLSRNYLYRGIQTRDPHATGLLHIEFQGCFNPTASGQGRSNSGIYMQNLYEVQVLDSFGSGAAIDDFGALYAVRPPLVNAALPPLTWHTYDIYFTPRSSGGWGDPEGAAFMTVYANGVLVQDSTPIINHVAAGIAGDPLLPAPLYLQNHGNEVVYNNIWFIPNATLSSLPYSEVLGGATALAREPRSKPLRDWKAGHVSGPEGEFDLIGRKVEGVKEITRIPSSPD